MEKLEGLMKLIDISTKKHPNTFTMVDNGAFAFLNQWKWYAWKKGNNLYAHRNICLNGKKTIIRMHRIILGNPSFLIDHFDGDGCNNLINNLRLCTNIQNIHNSKLHKDSTTGFKGVSVYKNKFRARIRFRAKEKSLGYFETKNEAALAYNKAAKKYFGEFARLNNIPIPSEIIAG